MPRFSPTLRSPFYFFNAHACLSLCDLLTLASAPVCEFGHCSYDQACAMQVRFIFSSKKSLPPLFTAPLLVFRINVSFLSLGCSVCYKTILCKLRSADLTAYSISRTRISWQPSIIFNKGENKLKHA